MKRCIKQTMSKATIFSFIQNYVNDANIAWESTSKSKLEHLLVVRKMLLE